MSAEGTGYTPEDLLQTEGENKGNVKDKVLAEKEAIAEDKYHGHKIRKALRFFADEVIAAGSGRRGLTDSERQENDVNQAAKTEIESRVRAAAESNNVHDEEAIQQETYDATRELREKEEELTKERIEEQRKKIRGA